MREQRAYLFTTTVAAVASIVLILSLLGLGADFGANVWPQPGSTTGDGSPIALPEPAPPARADVFSAPATVGLPIATRGPVLVRVSPDGRGAPGARGLGEPPRRPRGGKRSPRAPAAPSPAPASPPVVAPPAVAPAAPAPVAPAAPTAQQADTSRPADDDRSDDGDDVRPQNDAAADDRDSKRDSKPKHDQAQSVAPALVPTRSPPAVEDRSEEDEEDDEDHHGHDDKDDDGKANRRR